MTALTRWRFRPVRSLAATARHRLASERGAASVELVLIAPALVAVILLLVAGGRLSMAGTAVESAAASAARAVSLAASSSEADDIAAASASLALAERDVACTNLSVSVDAAALDSVLGVNGEITITIACTVALDDVALPGLGGSQAISATATSPVDPYRARG